MSLGVLFQYWNATRESSEMSNTWCRWCGRVGAVPAFMSCGVGECGTADLAEMMGSDTGVFVVGKLKVGAVSVGDMTIFPSGDAATSTSGDFRFEIQHGA